MEKKQITNEITRKEALQRMGKYAALTAVGTFLVLNPKTAQASSPIDPGGNNRTGPAPAQSNTKQGGIFENNNFDTNLK